MGAKISDSEREIACFSGAIGSFWSILAVHFLCSCKVGTIKSVKSIPLRGPVQFYRIRAAFLPGTQADADLVVGSLADGTGDFLPHCADLLDRNLCGPEWPKRLQFHCAPEGGNYL
jgi:hypothetical protein